MRPVENVKAEITVFIKRLLDENDWDIIVPILRKGGLVLLSTIQNTSKFHLPPFYDIDHVGKKKILIFDDKAMHGHTIRKKYEEVIAAGAEKTHIRTAVFIKNKNCEFPIDHCYHELDGLDYDTEESNLNLYFESLCLQLDADHLVAKCSVVSDHLETTAYQNLSIAIRDNTSDIGVFYRQNDSIARFWGRQKFAIADISLSRLELGSLSQLLIDEGVRKMRFCLEPCGDMLIMPIFYPSQPIASMAGSTCKLDLTGKVKFCEQILEENSETSFCRECIDFNVQMCALRTLLPVLSQRLIKVGYAIRINSLSWPELEYGYPKFKAVLEQQLHEMKKS